MTGNDKLAFGLSLVLTAYLLYLYVTDTLKMARSRRALIFSAIEDAHRQMDEIIKPILMSDPHWVAAMEELDEIDRSTGVLPPRDAEVERERIWMGVY